MSIKVTVENGKISSIAGKEASKDTAEMLQQLRCAIGNPKLGDECSVPEERKREKPNYKESSVKPETDLWGDDYGMEELAIPEPTEGNDLRDGSGDKINVLGDEVQDYFDSEADSWEDLNFSDEFNFGGGEAVEEAFTKAGSKGAADTNAQIEEPKENPPRTEFPDELPPLPHEELLATQRKFVESLYVNPQEVDISDGEEKLIAKFGKHIEVHVSANGDAEFYTNGEKKGTLKKGNQNYEQFFIAYLQHFQQLEEKAESLPGMTEIPNLFNTGGAEIIASLEGVYGERNISFAQLREKVKVLSDSDEKKAALQLINFFEYAGEEKLQDFGKGIGIPYEFKGIHNFSGDVWETLVDFDKNNKVPPHVKEKIDALKKNKYSDLKVESAYRSSAYQLSVLAKEMYYFDDTENVMKRKKTFKEALTSASLPGFSEHGTENPAIDISQMGGIEGMSRSENALKTLSHPKYMGILKDMTDQGFILTYPFGTPKVVNGFGEPWHFLHMGKEKAKAFYEKIEREGIFGMYTLEKLKENEEFKNDLQDMTPGSKNFARLLRDHASETSPDFFGAREMYKKSDEVDLNTVMKIIQRQVGAVNTKGKYDGIYGAGTHKKVLEYFGVEVEEGEITEKKEELPTWLSDKQKELVTKLNSLGFTGDGLRFNKTIGKRSLSLFFKKNDPEHIFFVENDRNRPLSLEDAVGEINKKIEELEENIEPDRLKGVINSLSFGGVPETGSYYYQQKKVFENGIAIRAGVVTEDNKEGTTEKRKRKGQYYINLYNPDLKEEGQKIWDVKQEKIDFESKEEFLSFINIVTPKLEDKNFDFGQIKQYREKAVENLKEKPAADENITSSTKLVLRKEIEQDASPVTNQKEKNFPGIGSLLEEVQTKQFKVENKSNGYILTKGKAKITILKEDDGRIRMRFNNSRKEGFDPDWIRQQIQYLENALMLNIPEEGEQVPDVSTPKADVNIHKIPENVFNNLKSHQKKAATRLIAKGFKYNKNAKINGSLSAGVVFENSFDGEKMQVVLYPNTGNEEVFFKEEKRFFSEDIEGIFQIIDYQQ